MLARIAWMAVLLYGGAASPLGTLDPEHSDLRSSMRLMPARPLGARVRVHRGATPQWRPKPHHSHASCRQARRPR